MEKVILKAGREKSLLRKHLWVFSGAVDSVSGEVASGDTVEICDAKGNFLAYGAWSPASQLRIRVWSFDRNEVIDGAFFVRRIAAAAELRRFLKLDDLSGGCRLVNSEGDDLPGLVVDRYGEFLCVQFSGAGAEFHREEILDALESVTHCRGIFERSDLGVRAKENLPERSGVLRGEPAPNPVIIEEDDLRFAVDLRHGQKTGFYFDQRDARKFFRTITAGKRVLNTFSYTGGFALAALKGGAKFVLNVDSSEPALRLAAHNLEMNRFGKDLYENCCADVFEKLRQLAAEKLKFDVIVLDPPKLIDSQKSLVRGCRAYQDLARLGYTLLSPGGILLNFSCSGLMTPELLQKITADAALEANVRAVLLRKLEQSPDHPVSLAVPESFYLKGFVSRIDV